jgi:YVTN family beta-propeller protein
VRASQHRACGFVAACLIGVCGQALAQTSFVTFEAGQVRPLALSPDGRFLYAANTPDGELEVFNVGAGGVSHAASIPVGMEPVAIAVRNDSEVWVVNHLSDSVSIVDVANRRVVRTLLVGDEPRDIIFAGPGRNRAFITTAHRGQQRTHPSLAGVPGAGDPQLTTAGVPRADVWVFDATNPGSALGGVPLRIIRLFGDTPRGLAVSPDGNTVYAAVFHSGNQTTVVPEGAVCNGYLPFAPCPTGDNGFVGAPGGNPGPATNIEGKPAPEVGLVVQWNAQAGQWQDELARDWNAAVMFTLPDEDIFRIDATTLQETGSWSGVGTILFNLAVNPANGNVYVSNTDARNEVRFEGPGGGGSTVQGHLHESRISVISGAQVKRRHLNKHIDYGVRPAPAGTKDHSLATPLQMVVSSNGQRLYVAAFGSGKVGVYDTAVLDGDAAWDAFDPVDGSAAYITLTAGGPSGLALDEARNRLYVLTRFDDAVAAIDLATGREIAHVSMHNPEPAAVVEGRPFLYDAMLTSSNGEASCSSCHVFGDLDSLGWDLGNPDDIVTTNPIPINLAIAAPTAPAPINGTGVVTDFHPMKGPMTTQTLRGLVNGGAMHWRGDRSVGVFGTDPFDTSISFDNFNVAFPGLVGRDAPLAAADMQKFTDFALQITLPPNPVRALDNSLTSAQQAARNFYFGPRSSDGLRIGDLNFNCNGCHVLDAAAGHFGNGGNASFEQETQTMKIPHLRNAYQKIGMFGMAAVRFFQSGDNGHKGDQIRGFGFMHDGATDTLIRFFHANVFNTNDDIGFDAGAAGEQERLDMEQFVLAFDNDIAPIVGQQITLTSTSGSDVQGRVDLLLERAEAAFVSKILGGNVTDCDVVVKGRVGGVARGWLYRGGGSFEADDGTNVSETALRALAQTPGQELTWTCEPPGSGRRAGINRDEDAFDDALDNCPARANDDQEDSDEDGVGEVCDNCTLAANASQRDTDGDGYGNMCDADFNENGFINFADLGYMKANFFSTDPDADLNGDGFVNFVDLGLMKEQFFGPPGPSGVRTTP